jgi:methylglutaconyl-CoA hydratase
MPILLTIEELDKITDFSTKLSSYNPEALNEKKCVEGTQHWDTLFLQRALFREVSSI